MPPVSLPLIHPSYSLFVYYYTQHTSLRSHGIFVRKLVPDGTAMQDGRLMIGDRIVAVNGTSLVGADYNR